MRADFFRKFIKRKQPAVASIRCDERGFSVRQGKKIYLRILWEEIDAIIAYKEDHITTDLVCLDIVVLDADIDVKIHEEMEGYNELVLRIKQKLPGSLQEWESRTLQPAFAENRTVIFDKSHN